jgi:hypothetical protein
MSAFDTELWRALTALEAAAEPFWREYTDRVMLAAIADFERELGLEPTEDGAPRE